MAKDRFQQAVLIGVGVMVAIGFSGIFTWGSLVGGGSDTLDRERERVNATLPQQNYLDGSFNLSVRQQAFLSVNEQVVFVNALYDNQTEFPGIQELPQTFQNRVYVNKINTSEELFATQFQLETPGVLVIGDQPTRRQRFSVATAEPNRSSIINAVCSSMEGVSQFAATCY
jgi:hypothetical protein